MRELLSLVEVKRPIFIRVTPSYWPWSWGSTGRGKEGGHQYSLLPGYGCNGTHCLKLLPSDVTRGNPDNIVRISILVTPVMGGGADSTSDQC